MAFESFSCLRPAPVGRWRRRYSRFLAVNTFAAGAKATEPLYSSSGLRPSVLSLYSEKSWQNSSRGVDIRESGVPRVGLIDMPSSRFSMAPCSQLAVRQQDSLQAIYRL